MTSAARLSDLVAAELGKPMYEIMRDDEAARGFNVIKPGDVVWLPVIDWDHTVVVSETSQNEIRLVVIVAKKPGNGAFRRLISGIIADGKTPVICCPTREMAATLTRWGWVARINGKGFHAEEQWRPKP